MKPCHQLELRKIKSRVWYLEKSNMCAPTFKTKGKYISKHG